MNHLQILFNEALKSTLNHQISCIILDNKNRIISIGHNRTLIHSSGLNQCLL